MKNLERIIVTLILIGLFYSMNGMQAFAEDYYLPLFMQKIRNTNETWDNSDPLTEHANDSGPTPILLEIERLIHNLKLVTSDSQKRQMQEQIDMWYSRLDQLGY